MARNGFLFFFGAALLAMPVVRADEPVVFRSDVSLVRVDAQVVDRDHRVITGLGPRDFVLREQGRPQPVQSVDSENLPIDLVLLLDVSASMRPHDIEEGKLSPPALLVGQDNKGRSALMKCRTA